MVAAATTQAHENRWLDMNRGRVRPQRGCEFISGIYYHRLPNVALRRSGEQRWALSRSAVGAGNLAMTIMRESFHHLHHPRNCEVDSDLGTACLEEAVSSSPGLSASFLADYPGYRIASVTQP